jgi:hypothetical protein
MRTKQELFKDLKFNLGRVEAELVNLKRVDIDPSQKKAHFANIVIWGRTVTFVLQNLRSVIGEQEFNSWYEPIQAIMKADELLKFL